jgi:hypothetical protein
MLMLAAVALGEGGFLFPDTRDNFGGFMVFMAFILAMASLGFFGYGIVDAVEARRSLRQAPPRPGPGGRGLESGRPVRKPAPPGPRDDQTRADLRAHISRRIDRRLPSQVPGWEARQRGVTFVTAGVPVVVGAETDDAGSHSTGGAGR